MKPYNQPKHDFYPYLISRIAVYEKNVEVIKGYEVIASSGAIVASFPTYDKAHAYILERLKREADDHRVNAAPNTRLREFIDGTSGPG